MTLQAGQPCTAPLGFVATDSLFKHFCQPRVGAPVRPRTMYLCCGNKEWRMPMDHNQSYTAARLASQCPEYGRIFLEYHPGLFIRLPRDNCLALACEMVAGYHNKLRVYSQADVWSSFEPTWINDSLCMPPMWSACDDPDVACPSPTSVNLYSHLGTSFSMEDQSITGPRSYNTDSSEERDETDASGSPVAGIMAGAAPPTVALEGEADKGLSPSPSDRISTASPRDRPTAAGQ